MAGTIVRAVKGKSSHQAKKIELNATQSNVSLHATKSVNMQGESGGAKFGEYVEPQEDIIPSQSQLVSDYAHQQLIALANDLDQVSFIIFLLPTFGTEIETEAYYKLYKNLREGKVKPPEIVVSKIPVKGYFAGYSVKRKQIIVYEGFLKEALKDNDKRAMLLAALLEEYGHHIETLLRYDYSPKPIPDTDTIDAGAKFAHRYFIFSYNILEDQNTIPFGSALIEGVSTPLFVDFSSLQTDIKKYVDESQQYDENPTEEDIKNFGAGRNRAKTRDGAYAHGDIEFEALVAKDLYEAKDVYQIYYGNWLRDYSQVITALTVRLPTETIKKVQTKTGRVIATNPQTLSHEGWIKVVQLLAVKEFVFDRDSREKGYVTDDFNSLSSTFKTRHGNLDKDVLGIYRPEEHIDNPYGLPDDSIITEVSFKDAGSGTTKYLYAGTIAPSLKIDPIRKMSNFFWTDYDKRPAAVTFMKQQIVMACNTRNDSKTSFRYLGAALHVLEDYFAHTNFIEIALRKHGANVYPWVEGYEKKKYSDIPIVSGRFLGEDTVASIAPKLADILFSLEEKKQPRRKPGQRTLSEGIVLAVLDDLQKGNDPQILSFKSSTWLNHFNTYLKVQDYIATRHEILDNTEYGWPKGDDFSEKLANATNMAAKAGRDTVESVSDFMTEYNLNVVALMEYYTKFVFNILLKSVEHVVKETQGHINTGYGFNPSHTQLAKDSYKHPLNKLAGDLAKEAIADVTKKYRAGKMTGTQLANDAADTYFVHPVSARPTWIDSYIKDFISSNKDVINGSLKHATIYEHAHEETKKISDKMGKKIDEIISFFNKLTN